MRSIVHTAEQKGDGAGGQAVFCAVSCKDQGDCSDNIVAAATGDATKTFLVLFV